VNQTAPISVDRTQNIPAGIGLMVLAIFLFSVNDVLGKWLAARYSAPQILLFRGTAALIVLMPFVGRMGFDSLIRAPRLGLQLTRVLFGTAEVVCFYVAVTYLPLADAMTYYLAGPIYVTLLAAVFLREHVGWRRWTAVIVGFAGVVIALQPSAGSLSWPALIALLGSVLYAVFLVVTRSLRGTPDAVMATWQIGASVILGIVATPLTWIPLHRSSDTALLALLGVVALVGIVCINRSLRLAPASVVVPYQYTLIVWAILFGYIVFGDVPRWPTLVGAAIIIGAGLFIFFRERKLALPSEPEMPPEM
jgi:drug/metabolite transporter (DMT)-like permease